MLISTLFTVTVICAFIPESSLGASTTLNDQRARNFSKNFRRKFDTLPSPGKVHILEAGTRPLLNDPFDEILENPTSRSIENNYEDATKSSREDLMEGQESISPIKLANKMVAGVKSLFKSKRPPYPMPAYIKPIPNPYPSSKPTGAYPATLFPTSTEIPITTGVVPPIDIFPPSPPPITDVLPPAPPDYEDLGTFAPDFEDFTVKPSSGSATVVPILGVSSGIRSPPRFGRGRNLAKSTPMPKRRLVGGAIGSKSVGRLGEVVDDNPDVITDYMFSDIRCYRTKNKEYFGAMVHMKSGFHMPYIRDRPQDPMSSKECRMEPTDSPNSYHMKISDLRTCGVEQCGEQICLTMVFPRVPMLALADDEVTTIKCTPQKNMMIETKTLSFTGDASESRRSSSVVEGGGQEFEVEVGVFRQIPGAKNGLFVKRVNSGGVVQLGEPLQLRSVVRGGDGWAYSRLTDVKVWRMRDTFSHSAESMNPRDASEVITLVEPNGCRNSEYKVISGSHPVRDPRNALVHHFNFKAFLFRGQRANEPLVVTAKVQGCQDIEDCNMVDCSGTADDFGDDFARRKKREAEATEAKNSNGSAVVSKDFSSHFSLRVVGLKNHSAYISNEDFTNADLASEAEAEDEERPSGLVLSCNDKVVVSAIGSSFTVLLLTTLFLVLYVLCQRLKYRHNLQMKTSPPPIVNPNSILKYSSASVRHDVVRRANEIRNSQTSRSARNLLEHSGNSRRRTFEKPTSAQLAKILQQVANEQNDDGAEYECIPEHEPNDKNNSSEKSKNSDNVYVLYCYDDKRSRSKSAPGSLRENMKFSRNFSSKNEITEDSESSPDCTVERRTVRSVKQRSYRRQSRRSARTTYDHGSFSSRLSRSKKTNNSSKNIQTKPRASVREQFSPSEDSAYYDSMGSASARESSIDAKCRSETQGLGNVSKNSSGLQTRNKSISHCVSRSESSTNILIIPEVVSHV